MLTVTDSENNQEEWTLTISVTNCTAPNPLQANWLYGRWAGLNFGTGVPHVSDQAYDPYTMSASSATVVQNNELTGELLFYSNGTNVWNSAGQIINMEGNLISFSLANIPPVEDYEYPSGSTHFASVPFPGHPNEFRVFMRSVGDLVYTHVNMNEFGGEGHAYPLVNVGMGEFNSYDRIFSVPHCNGIDYWIIATSGNSFATYLLTESGLTNADFSTSEWEANLEPTVSVADGWTLSGPMEMYDNLILHFSNPDDKFVRFNFNNSTGLVSFDSEVQFATFMSYYDSFGNVQTRTFGNCNDVQRIMLSPAGNYVYLSGTGSGGCGGEAGLNHMLRFGLLDGELWYIHRRVRETIVLGPEPTAQQRIYTMRRNRDYVDAIHAPDAPDIADIEYQFEAVNYDNFGYMYQSLASRPDFLDGQLLPESPPAIVTTQVGCNTFNFSVQECYQNWTQTWNFGDGSPDLTEQNPEHQFCQDGSYIVTLTLMMGENDPAPVVLTAPLDFICTQPPLTTTTSDIDCPGACDGSISITSGGSFSLEWEGPGVMGSTDPTLTGLCPGEYVATITFENFCPFTETFIINGATMDFPGGYNYLGPDINWDNAIADGTLVLGGNLVVGNGTDFDLLDIDDLQVQMTGLHKITVEQASHMIANDCTFDVGCATRWTGFEVQANYGNNSTSNRGRVWLTDCIVTHADVGVKNFEANALNLPINATRGGRIRCVNTQFRNNRQDLDLRGFIPTFNCSGSSYGAYFSGCTFHFDSWPEYPPTGQRIYLRKIGGVYFGDCTLENVHPTYTNTSQLYGINAERSSFTWTGCPLPSNGIPCNITENSSCLSDVKGFTYGIRVNGDLADEVAGESSENNPGAGITTGVLIERTTFRCFRAVMEVNCSSIDIMRSSCQDLSVGNNPPYGFTGGGANNATFGFYVEGNKRFNIAENMIDLTNTGNANRFGIIVRNTGANDNYVYRNTLRGLTRALNFRGNNRNGSNFLNGLRYECNIFDGNRNDVVINGDGTLWGGTVDNGGLGSAPGVASPQRNTLDSPGENTGSSAGNKFVNSMSAATCDDISQSLTPPGAHQYRYFPTIGQELNTNGTSEMGISCNITPIPTSNNPQDQNSCGFSLTLIPPGEEEEEHLSMATEGYDDAHAQWLALVDNGDTESLTEEVIYSTFSDALELYYNLMAASPALSEEVMLEAIQKEYELPAVLLTQILASNPTAALSHKIQKALDNRMMPLEEYQREEINEALSWVSQKQILENQMQDFKLQRNTALSDIAHSISVDETIVNPTEQLLVLLDENKFADERLWKVDLLFRSGYRQEALDMLASTPEVFKLDDDATEELNDLLMVYALENQLVESGLEELTEAQILDLEYIVYTRPNAAKAKAVDMLVYYNGLDYHPDLENYDGMEYQSLFYTKNPVQPLLHVHPNPFKELLMVDLKMMTGKVSRLQLTDIVGPAVLSVEPQSEQIEVALDLRFLSQGHYLLSAFGINDVLLEVLPVVKQP